jgi:hypothetical protein
MNLATAGFESPFEAWEFFEVLRSERSALGRKSCTTWCALSKGEHVISLHLAST